MPTTGKKKKTNRGAKGEGSLIKRGRFWTFKAPNGKRYPTGTQIKSEATTFKLSKLTELRTGQPHIVSKAKGSTVNQLLDAHLAFMRRKNRKSAQDVSWVLDLHVRPYFGERVASSLGTADFERYRVVKKAEGLEDTTINRHMSYICSGYTTGLKRVTPRLVDSVPYFPTTDESGNVRQGFLMFDGYAKIRAKLPVSLKPLFVCAFHVSTRKGELKNILWSQVDFDEGLIRLDPPNTKNKSGRALPIYGDMMEVLEAQKELRDRDFPDCEHVFFWHAEDVAISNFLRPLVGKHIGNFAKMWHAAVTAAGYILVKLLFIGRRKEVLRDRDAPGEADVLLNLFPQSAFAEGLQALPENQIPLGFIIGLDVLEPERFGITENLRVYDAHQPVQLHQRVLKWRRRQQKFVARLQRLRDCSRRFVRAFEDVS